MAYVYGLYMGVILTTYNTWDDHPSTPPPPLFLEIRLESSYKGDRKERLKVEGAGHYVDFQTKIEGIIKFGK